jgi:hypothetical protein
MKKYALFVLPLLLFSGSLVRAQSETPVTWTVTTTRMVKDTIELRVRATLAKGWHIYAHDQPKTALSKPTDITFAANPLLSVAGHLKEIGTKEKQAVEALNIEQYMYEGQVDFIQTFVLSSPVKTNISGSIVFQACTDHQCLRPQEQNFSVAVQ